MLLLSLLFFLLSRDGDCLKELLKCFASWMRFDTSRTCRGRSRCMSLFGCVRLGRNGDRLGDFGRQRRMDLLLLGCHRRQRRRSGRVRRMLSNRTRRRRLGDRSLCSSSFGRGTVEQRKEKRENIIIVRHRTLRDEVKSSSSSSSLVVDVQMSVRHHGQTSSHESGSRRELGILNFHG